MGIILPEDVRALGKKGQIVKVSDGYTRNSILSKKLDLEATSKNLNNLKLRKVNNTRIAAEQLIAAKGLGVRLDESIVTLSTKAGEGRRAFDSMSNKEISRATSDQLNLGIDKKRTVLNDPIKSIGNFKAPIKLYKEVTVRFAIKVTEA